MLKKIWKFLSSMKFAVILLIILIVSCALGSFIPQGKTLEAYTELYQERVAALIVAAHLDDVFHSVWFLVLAAFLAFNLIFCNVSRIGGLIRRFQDARKPAEARGDVVIKGVTDPEEVFRKMRHKAAEDRDESGRKRFYSVKNRAGIFGAWVCHLGILLLLIGFVLGQMTKEEYTVFGVPGDKGDLGETGSVLLIHDFTMDVREDSSVSQYTSSVTLKDPAGNEYTGTASVNYPADLNGFRIYQNSYGYVLFVVVRIGEETSDAIPIYLSPGESTINQYLPLGDSGLDIVFNAFYPDYFYEEGQAPGTKSAALKNPVVVYTITQDDQIITMGLLKDTEATVVKTKETGEEIAVVGVVPQYYTLLQVKRDRFTLLALFGGLTILVGLFLAFYLRLETISAVEEADGSFTVYAKSGKGSVIFKEKLELACGRTAEEGGENP